MRPLALMDPSASRPLADFHSTTWGHHFLNFQLQEISTQEKLELEELKEIVRKMLVETPDNTTQKLVLIDTIQRLGIAYHFDNEIETSIQNIFDAIENNVDDNLNVVALRFRLVRQQGHYMSSDVFKKFTNSDGIFMRTLVNDVEAFLNLYEAAHLRVHGEEILEEALIFTTTHLESMLPNLSNSLKAQVTQALSHPIRKAIPRLAARKYIDIYKGMESHNDLLLKFAKFDFNMLQKLHQREISELTSWWKDLDLVNKFPYARNKLVEGYSWTLALYFEPRFSRARIMLLKVFKMLSICDDTYDAYATFDELVLLTDAIQRWDISAMDSLPPYMRPFYQAMLDVFNEMEEVLAKEDKSDRIYYGKFEVKKLARAYFKEAKWLNAGYIPTCEEYIENAIVSNTFMALGTLSLIGMEELITKDIFEWITSEPSIVRASSTICRLMDDISDHEVQQQRGHVASIIECFMKEYGASKEEAYVKFRKEVRNSWKDINKALLRPTEVPTFVLERVLNLARSMDTHFQDEEDGYTDSTSKSKDVITLLLVEPVNI
ncbi:germacrene c synthase [Nicotiana attenuata]|uniref:Germacrene c synthase n=2 Tax=Nicotiana attenuata TaxID=49451 RepID=A0A314KZ70_NICAT|nr:germacrene c synthase [Nicotiana attenuata]